MKIRKAKKEDFERLLKLLLPIVNKPEEKIKRKISKYLLKKDKTIIVAEDKEKIIGYSFLDYWDDDPKINKFLNSKKFTSIAWIGVDSNYRKQKIGSKLLKYSEKVAKKWKQKGIVLDCRKQVLSFYEKNSYTKAGYFIKKEDVKKPRRQYVMIKKF